MNTIALDTNLLLLLLVDRTAPAFLTKHKRLRAYTARDFNRLLEAMRRARAVRFTPHCIAEVSNLLGHGVDDPLRTHLFRGLRAFIETSEERSQSSRSASNRPEFLRLGITDAAWLEMMDQKTILLTDDGDLHRAATALGLQVVNFTHPQH